MVKTFNLDTQTFLISEIESISYDDSQYYEGSVDYKINFKSGNSLQGLGIEEGRLTHLRGLWLSYITQEGEDE